VDAVVEIALADLFVLLNGRLRAAEAQALVYDPRSSLWRRERLTVDNAAFLPRIPNYYLSVAIMAERLLEGRRPLAIG
jgi:hypothetical protein